MKKIQHRLAVIAIVLEDEEKAPVLNETLHQYQEFIIGRMGIPHRSRGINLISIAIDAPLPVINALTGNIGRIPSVSAKTAFSKDPLSPADSLEPLEP